MGGPHTALFKAASSAPVWTHMSAGSVWLDLLSSTCWNCTVYRELKRSAESNSLWYMSCVLHVYRLRYWVFQRHRTQTQEAKQNGRRACFSHHLLLIQLYTDEIRITLQECVESLCVISKRKISLLIYRLMFLAYDDVYDKTGKNSLYETSAGERKERRNAEEHSLLSVKPRSLSFSSPEHLDVTTVSPWRQSVVGGLTW